MTILKYSFLSILLTASLWACGGDEAADPSTGTGAGGNAGQTGGAGGAGGQVGATGGAPGMGGNPGGGGASGGGDSIYSVKEGRLVDEAVVTVDGVVTALRLNDEGRYSHLVVQVAEDNGAYRSVENSGLWVYLNNTDMEPLRDAPPPVGSWVSLTGQVNHFYDQWQIQHVERLDVLGQAALPTPVVVNAADIATGGARAWVLEGSLVTVQNVEVTQLEPEAGPGDGQEGAPTNEFLITGNLRVDDYFYLRSPAPSVGDRFQSITGVLRYGNGHSKIEPRDANDYR
jgi:large repetitive protein